MTAAKTIAADTVKIQGVIDLDADDVRGLITDTGDYIGAVAVPPVKWTAPAKDQFPSVAAGRGIGVLFNQFEQEIAANFTTSSVAADGTAIVNKYMNLYQQQNSVDAAALVQPRTWLNQFVTDYITWLAS